MLACPEIMQCRFRSPACWRPGAITGGARVVPGRSERERYAETLAERRLYRTRLPFRVDRYADDMPYFVLLDRLSSTY